MTTKSNLTFTVDHFAEEDFERTETCRHVLLVERRDADGKPIPMPGFESGPPWHLWREEVHHHLGDKTFPCAQAVSLLLKKMSNAISDHQEMWL